MNIFFIIVGAIVFIGLVFFSYCFLKIRKKHKAIKHYEEIRDQLTLRQEEKEIGYGIGFDLGNVIGASDTLVELATLFFALVMVISAIGIIAAQQ